MKFSLLIDATLLGVVEVSGSGEVQGAIVGRDSCPTLTFDKGVLNIHNPFNIRCDSGEGASFNSIVGCSVSDAFSNEVEFVIVFEGRIFLSISLKDEDFIGPEAAVYGAKSGEIVVF